MSEPTKTITDICEGCVKECSSGGLPGCAEWRKRFIDNWNRNICKCIKPKREHFCYEHPDLVREGIIWTGEPEPKPRKEEPMEQEPGEPEEQKTGRYQEKICLFCGKPYPSKNNNQRYCCPGCQQNAYYARAREKRQKALEERHSVVCGGLIPPSRKLGSLTCSKACCNRLGIERTSAKRARERMKRKHEMQV